MAAGRIAEGLLRRAVARLPIRLEYPDGSVIGAADPTLPTMVVHQPKAMARRVGRYGLIGFGESYMAGEWESTDLAGVMTAFANSVADLIPPALQRLRPLAVVRHPRSMYNSLTQARDNIAEHYDLSNELFAEFLDDTMTYSSALFETSRPGWDDLVDGSAPQDRPPARLRPRGPGQPCSRNRYGLGRVVHSGGVAWRARPLDHAVRRATAHGAAARRRGRPVRSGGDRTQGLPRGRRTLRRGGVGRDDRGRRISVLAHVLPHARSAGVARRACCHPGDHHAARSNAACPATPTRGFRSTSSRAG